MTTFTWRIDQLMAEKKVGDLENVVVKITWICEATDGEFKTHIAGFLPIQLDQGAPFTPYEEITEAMVLEWVNARIDKALIEESLETVIQGNKYPQYIYLPVPWSQS